jgi:hypothetical protein
MTRNGPKVGGFPRTVETLHVRADGRATGTREDDDNVLYAVSESPIDAATVLETLGGAWPEMPVPVQSAPNEPVIVSEYHEAYTALWLAGEDGNVRHWSGDADTLPEDFRQAVDRIERQLSTPRALPTDSPRVFLRAHWLSPESEAESQRAGLLRQVQPDVLAQSRALHEAIAKPFTLIPLEPGENPFTVFGRELEPGRTVLELVYEDRACQVRVLRAADGV